MGSDQFSYLRYFHAVVEFTRFSSEKSSDIQILIFFCYCIRYPADDMCELAVLAYNCNANVVESTLLQKYKYLLAQLLMQHPVLIAYDCDRNFSPCINNGHSSHWALITGT